MLSPARRYRLTDDGHHPPPPPDDAPAHRRAAAQLRPRAARRASRAQVLPAARLAEQLASSPRGPATISPVPAPGLDAPTCLAASAAVTERIALGLSVMLLGPAQPGVDGQAARHDRPPGRRGRLRLGVGVGGEFPAEFEAAGVPVSQRGARLDDSLAVIGDLLTGQPVHYAGADADGHARPRSSRRWPPPPPIYVGGRGEPALRRAARHGDVWMPMWLTPARIAERSQQLGRPGAEREGRPAPGIAPLILVHIDDDRAHARAQAERTSPASTGWGWRRSSAGPCWTASTAPWST